MTRKATEILQNQRFGQLITIKIIKEHTHPHKNIWLCQCDCGKLVQRLGGSLYSKRTTSCSRRCNIILYNSKKLLGKRFGKLVVQSFAGIREYTNGTQHHEWLCKCDCGNEKAITTFALKRGTKSCGCLCPKEWLGYEEISGTYLSKIKIGAKKRKLEYNVTPKELWDLYIKQNRKCAISGLNINFVRQYDKNSILQQASLDRIDNTKGYIINNVQWVDKRINQIKMDMSQKEFIQLCQIVSDYNNG